MRAAVTRGGELVVAEVADVTPGSGHVVVRSLAAGICGSDLHALADFSHFAGLMEGRGLLAMDPAPTGSSATSSAPRSSSSAPTPRGTLPSGTRVCSVPIILGPTGMEQIGYSNHYPGALAEHMALQEVLLLPVADSLDTDLAALTEPMAVGEHAVGLAGLEPGSAVPRGRLRPRRAGGHRRAKGPGPRAGAGGRLLADPAPAGRGVRGRRGDRPGRAVAARTLDRPSACRGRSLERIAATMHGGRRSRSAVIFEAVGVPGMLAVPHRRRAAPQPDRRGGSLHADRHLEPFIAVTKEIEFRFSFGYTPASSRPTLDRLAAGPRG